MKRAIKYGVIILTTIILAFTVFTGLALYKMEIEDQYGDLQQLYYDLNSGDIIINKTTNEFGVIEKSWKRINIRTTTNDLIDLYHWFNKDKFETVSEIYRSKNGKIDIYKMSYSEIKRKIESSELKLISQK